MRKLLIILLLAVIAVAVWCFRYELLFRFQYARLAGLSCQQSDFQNDSCLNKLWAHRVNSIERYRLLEGKFAGLETDVTWDGEQKRFLVYHPPLEGRPVLLDSFMQTADTEKNMMWWDTREVTSADTAVILRSLNQLDRKHQLKMNVVLEVYDTAVANFLADHGYWVAQNIRTEWLQKYTREVQWDQLRRSISPRVSFISQEDRYVPMLKEHFPGRDIITWAIAFKNYFNREHLGSLVQDPQVKIVLVNVKSRYYR
ncbi:MAG TPA: hypothetical protein VF145_12415 [Chitinophagaceae bacterium]